jgi:hypothetical protein
MHGKAKGWTSSWMRTAPDLPVPGYFDVRDLEERWVRIWTKKGAMLVIPEGIYHRFTLDQGNHIKVRQPVCA